LNFIKHNDEVYYSEAPVITVGPAEIDFLKNAAAENTRRRARLCTHPGIEDALHEMLIVHMDSTYVRPHKHLGKSESFHIIEGALKVFLFTDDGELTDTIDFGASGSGRNFYYRLSTPMFHSVLPVSDFVVFHEVTNGPFDRADCVFAPWAPSEDGTADEQSAFMAKLNSNS
jgi:cupin fold WbuC family metalloprotein